MEKTAERETIEFDDDAASDLPVVDGQLIDDSEETLVSERSAKHSKTGINIRQKTAPAAAPNQKSYLQYIFLPFVFLTVALFGGLRVAASDNAFVFLKPPLVCLIFATILLALFLRTGLIRLDGWFSESFSTLKNIANAAVLIALFAATVQIFNSLLPEQGLPFWVFAFCFFWTLVNNLFSVFDARRLLQSVGSLLGFAFLVKYLVLARLTAPASASWWRAILENPTQEFFTFLFDLPRFAPATGYIQFFAVVFYLLGLFLLAPASVKTET